MNEEINDLKEIIKNKDMVYDPERERYIGKDGSELRVTPYSDGTGYKYDYYDKSTYGNAVHNSVHIKSDLNKNWTRIDKDSSNNTKKESSGSGCYLTTACLKVMQEHFDDNCYYLDMLRWFRDNYVTEEDINMYYSSAPLIVEKINLMDNSNEIFKEIYYKVIQVCVRGIELGRYDIAYDVYKNSFLLLKKEFLDKKNMVLSLN